MRLRVSWSLGLTLILLSCRLGDLPGAPTDVVAVAGDGQAAVRWKAPPVPNGGKPILSYTVTATPGGKTAKATRTSATVSGLANGGTYTFTVTATNEVGSGLPSAPSAPVMPVPAVAFDTAEVPVTGTASSLDPSWRWGPFMQIYVRAYRDSDGDGEGDLAGLVEKLDYLKDLGIRGILLLPIFPSQDRTHGYRTTNWRDIAPEYGSLADLDRLLTEAHARGIGVILDGVFMYSAPAHPGFASASASPASPWRDWYVWSAVAPEPDPAPEVTWAQYWWQTPTGWYYGLYENNPAFDWKVPAVRAYHENTLRFWLDRGVDGFRIDALSSYVQNGPGALYHQPEDYQIGAELRQVVAQYQNRLMLCEAPFEPALPDQPFDENVYPLGLPNYAGSDVCGGGYLFSLITGPLADGTTHRAQAVVHAVLQGEVKTHAMARLVQDSMEVPIGSMATMIANHDEFAGTRLWNQLGGDGPAYRLAAATLLLMPGTPELYYGEEVGMANTRRPTANPGSDYHQRGVMSWTGDPANAGFSASKQLNGPLALTDPDDKYLVPVPNAADHNVEAERADPGSLLNWYRQLIQLRRDHRALARGLYAPLTHTDGAWAFLRTSSDEEVLVVLNYAQAEQTIAFTAPSGSWDVLLALGASPAGLSLSDAPDPETPNAILTLPPQSLTVYRLARQAPPLGELFVRGSFNDWGAPEEAKLAYLGGDQYRGTIHLPAGPMVFKLAKSDWDLRVNVGLSGGGEVRLGEPRTMEQTWWRAYGHGSEVNLDVPADGLYQFTVDASDPYQPVVTVQPVPEPAYWQRPAQPPAPAPVGLSHVQDAAGGVTWFFSDGRLLALYNNRGNTFIEFWVDGANVLGGFARGVGLSNLGPGTPGHGVGYPYGQIDPVTGQIGGLWLGFWAGFGYFDTRWMHWNGINGGWPAEGFEVSPTADGRLDVHVQTRNSEGDIPLFKSDVHYYVSAAGIGVRSDVDVLSDLQPNGSADTGGQLLMTQVDSDFDRSLPWDESQPDLYAQLALDGYVQPLDPFPPYENEFTPSNVYTDFQGGPPWGATGLPDGALVTTDRPTTYLTAMGRPSRAANVALRIDRVRSQDLPPLEYYCEVNGDRDLTNFLYSAGYRNGEVIPRGVHWTLYGDLVAWTGADPEVLRGVPMLSDGIP